MKKIDNRRKNNEWDKNIVGRVGFFIDNKNFFITEIKELPRIGNIPIYFKQGKIPESFYNNKGDVDIVNAVNFFKKIKKDIVVNEIVFQDIENIKNQKDILKASSMAGFDKGYVRDWRDNIEALLVSGYNDELSYSVILFHSENNIKMINLYIIENAKIKNTINYTGDLEKNIIEISKDIKKNKIRKTYIAGDFINLEALKELFFALKIKAEISNFWQNFFDINDFIPNIFFKESHLYIKSYALALPEKALSFIFEYIYDENGFSERKNIILNYDKEFLSEKKNEKFNLEEKKKESKSIKKIDFSSEENKKNKENFKKTLEKSSDIDIFTPKEDVHINNIFFRIPAELVKKRISNEKINTEFFLSNEKIKLINNTLNDEKNIANSEIKILKRKKYQKKEIDLIPKEVNKDNILKDLSNIIPGIELEKKIDNNVISDKNLSKIIDKNKNDIFVKELKKDVINEKQKRISDNVVVVEEDENSKINANKLLKKFHYKKILKKIEDIKLLSKNKNNDNVVIDAVFSDVIDGKEIDDKNIVNKKKQEDLAVNNVIKEHDNKIRVQKKIKYTQKREQNSFIDLKKEKEEEKENKRKQAISNNFESDIEKKSSENITITDEEAKQINEFVITKRKNIQEKVLVDIDSNKGNKETTYVEKSFKKNNKKHDFIDIEKRALDKIENINRKREHISSLGKSPVKIKFIKPAEEIKNKRVVFSKKTSTDNHLISMNEKDNKTGKTVEKGWVRKNKIEDVNTDKSNVGLISRIKNFFS